jgi:hypothetical protein
VEERIGGALQRAGRERSSVTLVAVTKKFSANVIREGYQAGLRDFGENYVQEFAGKQLDLQDLSDCKFHMIGHVQSNKANLAASLFHLIHTVDTAKLMERVDRACAQLNRQMEALIEVKLSDEVAKAGVNAADVEGLLEEASRFTNLRVTGLMTMPPWSTNAEQSRPYFKKLAVLAKEHSLKQLSMGMSNDFEVAIEEGATIIRVGTALFGARPKPAGAEQ